MPNEEQFCRFAKYLPIPLPRFEILKIPYAYRLWSTRAPTTQGQLARTLTKDFLMGPTATELDIDPAHADGDSRSYLQQLQSHASHSSLRQLRSVQAQRANSFQEQIRHGA